MFAAIDALEAGLRELADDVDLFHAQDCISARAAARVRDAGADVPVFRTVHHVDDFTTAALIDCQRRAIVEPDRVFVVSEHWRELLRADYGVEARRRPNGVDLARFAAVGDARRRRAARRGPARAAGSCSWRSAASSRARAAVPRSPRWASSAPTLTPPPVLAVVGGHSFQDYRAYREAALARAAELGLDARSDVVLLGTVDDDELPHWYRARRRARLPLDRRRASGLASWRRMAAGLPVVASDLPVFPSSSPTA